MAEVLPTSSPWARLFLTFTWVHTSSEIMKPFLFPPACVPCRAQHSWSAWLETLPMLMGVSSLTSNELGLHFHRLFSSDIVKVLLHSASSPSILISHWCFPGLALLLHPEHLARMLSKIFNIYQRFLSACQDRESCCITCFIHMVGLMLRKFM